MIRLPDQVANAVARGGAGLDLTVIRLAALGDVLRTLPAVRVLRRGLPGARLRWVVDDRWADVLAGHPDVDGLVRFPRRGLQAAGGRPSRWPGAGSLLRDFRRRLTERDPGRPARLAIDFHGNLRSALVLALGRFDVRLGHDGHQQKEGNRWFLTHRVPSGDRRQSRMDRNLSLVRALGLTVDPLPDGGLPESGAVARRTSAAIADVLGDDRPYAVLSPGASTSQAYKRPPVEAMVEAVEALLGGGVAPVVVWGPGEREQAGEVVERSGGRAALAPPTTLDELAAALRGASLFVGGDSGPMHLACAVGCPVVAIYGPTDPAVNAPWGVRHERVFPERRAYTGIKRIDRAGGGFDGLATGAVARAVTTLLTDRR